MVPALHQFRNVLLRCSSTGEFPGIDRYRFLTNVECSLGCKLFVIEVLQSRGQERSQGRVTLVRIPELRGQLAHWENTQQPCKTCDVVRKG